MSLITRAFIESPSWATGAMFINYDEWGGFFDHVPPPKMADEWAKDGFDQLGFRVPTMLVSPWATGGRTAHGVYDHASILSFIEWNWGLAHLGLRDAASPNILEAFLPAVRDPAAQPDLTFDPAKLAYTAPPEAHVPCEARGHTPPPSDLWALAENGWFEHHGFKVFV
jgi:phospholipase C